jgi:hypothetical protein
MLVRPGRLAWRGIGAGFGGFAMVSKAILAIGLSMALLATTAQAQQTGSVRIQVNGHREVHGTGPDAKAEVVSVDRSDSRIVDIGANGRADVSGLADGVYIVQVGTGDRMGMTYVRVEAGKATTAEMTAQGLPNSSTFAGGGAGLVQAARDAAARCDRAAYDAAVAELDRDLSMAEINMRDLNRIIDEYGRLTNLPPDQQRLQGVFDSIARRGMQGRTTPGAAARAAGAPVEPGLVHLPAYLAAVKEKARLEARLAASRAARQQVPPFPQDCGEKKVGFLGDQYRFGLSVEVGYVSYDLPNYKAYAIEFNSEIVKKGFLNEDRDLDGVRYAGDGFFYIPGTDTMIRLRGSYLKLDGNSSPNHEFTPGVGERFNFNSPDGGFFTTSPVDGFRYQQDLKQYQVGLGVEKVYDLGGLSLKPYLGVQYSYIDVKDKSEFNIAGNFAHFEDKRSVNVDGYGLMFGLDAQIPIAGGFYGFASGGLEMRLNSSKATWRTELDTGVVNEQKVKLDDDKVTWGAMGSVGVGYRWQNFDLRAGATAGISNHYPTLDIETEEPDGDPDISWDQTSMYGFFVRGTMRF